VHKLTLLLTLAGCTSATAPVMSSDLGTPAMPGLPDLASPSPACTPLAPRATPPEVGVLPDDGEAPQVNVLMKAQSSIRLMVYEMGYGGILSALEEKAQAGVTVQVILDHSTTTTNTNQKYFTELQGKGVQVKWSDPKFTYMHAKFFVVDGEEAVVSTGNYSLQFSIQTERNFTAHLTDAEDVADLVALFDADWAGVDPDLSCTRLVVSPANSRQRILDLLGQAQTSLVMETMEFADPDVRQAVASRKQAGVDVRVLLADPSWITANSDAAAFLKGAGVPVKYRTTPRMHVKAFVVDGTIAYMGSENFSYTSLSQNREVGLFLGDASSVAPIAATFESDFGGASDF
jgi:cardiolipin synthase A/B